MVPSGKMRPAGVTDDAHVADLHLVGDAAQRDDGPVFKLEGWESAQLFDGPWQIANDEGIGLMGFPAWIGFLHVADIAQPLGHHTAGGGRDVDADPLTAKILRCDQCGAAAAEGVEDDVVLMAAGFDDAFQ